MDKGNETASRKCTFLHDGYFNELYDAFTAAFSDYVITFALTKVQFRNHINLNAVDLNRTVGCLDQGRIIGFSLNGFGDWDGKPTVYDAGTGVVPESRRQGISESMFGMMMPKFRDAGIKQCLLEVITTNTNAISLYEKLGFSTTRRLALLQYDEKLGEPARSPPNIEIRQVDDLDWEHVSTFWDGKPSWQNSIDAIKRSNQLKRILCAIENGKCVGYVVFSSKFGRVAQLAVDHEHRRRGIGTALIHALEKETSDGYSLQVINIDTAIANAMGFFASLGFYERLNQHEMLKVI